jgi:hypothetical protein
MSSTGVTGSDGPVESGRGVHVGDRQGWCHVDTAGASNEPTDAVAADFDLVVRRQ